MPSVSTTGPNAPPSREINPFATCWTRPGALAFHFVEGQNTEKLIAKLASQQWRGAIIGPHGCGKSTLVETLKPVIKAAGRSIRAIYLHDGQRRLPRHFLKSCAVDGNSLLIIDGYEQLGWPERLRLWLRCRRAHVGLLVTSHAPVRTPTLVHLSPDRKLIEQLVDDLCSEVSTTITRAHIAASHACRGSNVREILFDLYDRHEAGRRESNPCVAIA